jgi:hypothetical protein
LGKPFHQELAELPTTYLWACAQNLEELERALRPLRNYPLIVVGSGGSLSAAHLAAALHESRTGNLARVCTPLELGRSVEAGMSSGIMLVSAGGKNPDVLVALSEAVRAEPPWTAVMCGTLATPLAKLARANEFASLYEYSIPSRKDGFLATNSLLAAFTLLIRSAAEPGQSLPPTLADVLSAPDVMTFFESSSSGDLAGVLGRETLIVLHGSDTKSAALDLESKLTEAALARVQLADFRNFGHGRHHWLAKRASESAILAFSTPEDRSLCARTLALLPVEVPHLVANLPGSSCYRPLQALLYTFGLTARFGEARGIDPGRPSVPEFGRQLYHLRPLRRTEARFDTLPAEIRRKLRVAHLPSDSSMAEDFWTLRLREQHDRFREQSFEGVVFDYDGTLCSSHDRFDGPAADLASHLVKLLDRRITVAIATGRGQSVRRDLQRCLPPRHWEAVWIGYYNCSDISSLADDTAPDRSERSVESLRVVYEYLRSDVLLQETCQWSVRPHQITIEPLGPLYGSRLWQYVEERLHGLDIPGIHVVSSSHSVDVLAPGVSKRNLVKFLVKKGKVTSEERVLCVGDRGRWPGNDHGLLGHPFALSTDEVSADPLSGWNLAPAGCRGTQATRFYLDHVDVQPASFRLRLRGHQA